MAELTTEQLEKAQTMSLDELRALAIKEAAGLEVVETPPIDKSRDEKGRFKSNTDEEATEGTEGDDEEPAEAQDDEHTVYRKEIDNGNGVVEVFEADSLEELVDKIAEGKKNASIKIRELSQKVKVEDARTAQEKADDEYVVGERLKKEPKKTVEEIVADVIARREQATRTSVESQSRFVQTHPDFIPNEHNGREMQLEAQRLGFNEFNADSLEKAYQSLKARGILQLKAEESEEATEVEAKETSRIVKAEVETTQPRNQKKGSTIQTRSRTVAAPVNTQPSEDEAYAMPLEKLRELANKQLAERQAE